MSFSNPSVPELTEEQLLRIARSNDESMARKFQLLIAQQRQQYDAIVKVPIQQRLSPASP